LLVLLASEGNVVETLEVDGVSSSTERSFVDNYLSRGRHALQARGGVDDVTDDPFPVGGGLELDDRLTGGDRHPYGESESGLGLIELLDRFQDTDGCPHRPLRIVLVSHGSSEDGEHAIPHELFEPAPEPFDVLTYPRVINRETVTAVFGIGPFGVGGEANQVGEEDRDDPALLGWY
jgi:hypothetical protein